MPRRPTRQERDAAAVQTFAKQYGRKAEGNGRDPNDRSYDRALEQRIRKMPPQQLDELLREGEDDGER